MCLDAIYTKINRKALEVIYINAVLVEVNRLCMKSCRALEIDHPNETQHDSFVVAIL